jgi:molybdenum cofactor synthesis domain-containing protein
MAMDRAEVPTAAMLAIGDEILSGRTQDTNTNYIARFLAALGIDLREARVVPDVETEIVAAVNALRTRYSYVFTTGGIGPTHDDITADAIAKAFHVSIDYHPEALALIGARYKLGEFNEMRRRMARIPAGAVLIRNSVSSAPGFQLENVFVMAGVPMIMRAMLEDVAPRLNKGPPIHTCVVTAPVAEGRIAAALAGIQQRYTNIAVGSYPFYREAGFGTQLVVRGRDSKQADAAATEIENAVRSLGFEPSRENS